MTFGCCMISLCISTIRLRLEALLEMSCETSSLVPNAVTSCYKLLVAFNDATRLKTYDEICSQVSNSTFDL